MTTIKAITFDAGGTLLEPWPSVGAVYAEVAARHGCRSIAVEELNRRFARAWSEVGEFDYTRDGWARVVDRTFEGLVEKAPSVTFYPEIYERFGEPDTWRIYKDVVSTLEALASRGVRLGVVSNWDERLEPLLGSLGLRRHFESVVVSCSAGSCKPEREIFERAVKELGMQSGEVLHVGDDFGRDFKGARAAGLQSVWLQRGSAKAAPDQIATLSDLVQILSPGTRAVD